MPQIDDADLTDALNAQCSHAIYLVEQRGAHCLFSAKGDQKKLARQLHTLPWKDISSSTATTPPVTVFDEDASQVRHHHTPAVSWPSCAT